MAETKIYKGGCHCGKVRFEAETDLANTLTCNCSICAKRAPIHNAIDAAKFKLLSGQDALTDYRFNKKRIQHLFCSTCGVESFARGQGQDGKEMVMINARCLDDVDVAALTPRFFDGKNRL